MTDLILSEEERAVLDGRTGSKGLRLAMQMVAQAARVLDAPRLVPISSSHIDGCLYHGEAGVLFAEMLADNDAQVSAPTTTNVGALNLLKPAQSRLQGQERALALRLMRAHERMGCRPSWTCAPYQAGQRPALGEQIAWGESNAVAFANTVLGARTNRYGDFLDIACAIAGRAPYCGLHVAENRLASLVIDLSSLPLEMRREDWFFAVLGSGLGRLAGERVCAVLGLPTKASDDQLKALCAGAASTGAAALIHCVGLTPEAPDLDAATGGRSVETITLKLEDIGAMRDRMSAVAAGPIDCVALGSPHFSADECRELLALARCGDGAPFKAPVYVCTGRHTLEALRGEAVEQELAALGVEFVVDTCVVVTPILPEPAEREGPGVLMTNSAKFAHYSEGNTGYRPVFGTLAECVLSAQAGEIVRNSASCAGDAE